MIRLQRAAARSVGAPLAHPTPRTTPARPTPAGRRHPPPAPPSAEAPSPPRPRTATPGLQRRLVDAEGLPCAPLPAKEPLHALLVRPPELFPEGGIGEERLEPGDEGLGTLRVAEEPSLAVHEQFGDGPPLGGYHGQARGHRLSHRQPEPLQGRGKEK